MKRLQEWWRWLQCRRYGHPAYPTGRGHFGLYEVCCQRCYKRFVANPREPGILLPVDADFERLMQDEAEYLCR